MAWDPDYTSHVPACTALQAPPIDRVSIANMAALGLLSCVFLTLCACAWGQETRLASVVKDGDGKLQVVDGWREGAIVKVNFTNQINTTGWSFLKIEDNSSSSSDTEVATAAGLAEGTMTGDLILMQWKNTLASFCSKPSELCDKIFIFIENNTQFMQDMVDTKASVDPFWYHVQLFYDQLAGLWYGYNSLGLEPLSMIELFLMQIAGDLDALQSALSNNKQPESKVIGAGKCSALVKLLPDNADLFVSHDTWSEYQSMLRIYKLYDFKFTLTAKVKDAIPGHRMSFSSYPGVLLSGDDFYQISSGLVTTETTFGNSNPDLWSKVTPECVFEGIRTVVANRLSGVGEEWCATFSQYNSGTYNNQWMVVDYKKFERGQAQLQNGLLWVLEQLPGLIVAKDQTDMLRKTSYWPSFNIPYYPTIYNQSGFAALAEKYGSWFTWSGSPRAQIYARNHTDVIDLTSMIDLMRYNNFQHDPLSRCNCTPPYSGENAISARSDLNPASGTYPFGALGHRCHGGTDNKVASSEMMKDLSCMATSGPTHTQQPVFQWSTSGYPRPDGHPDKWNFSPVNVVWST